MHADLQSELLVLAIDYLDQKFSCQVALVDLYFVPRGKINLDLNREPSASNLRLGRSYKNAFN